MDGAVVPEQVGQQGQPLADEQHRPGPAQGAGYAGEIHRDRVGLSGAFQLHRVVPHQVVLVQGVRGLPADPQPVKGDRDALGLTVQGRDAVIAGLHPGNGVRGGDPPDVHQGHHVGTAVLCPKEQAGGGHEDQQQVHHKKDAQLAEEKTEIQAEYQGGPGSVEGIPVGRGLKAAAFWHGGPPFWGGESGGAELSSPG